MAVLQRIWLYEIIGGTLPIWQNTTMRVNGAWIKKYCALCSKTYKHSCHNFPAGSRQAARGARICETSLLDSNRRFFSPCDLEIWWMTSKNDRAPLLHYIKLCASSQTPRWIQTGVTVRKCSIRVKISDFCHVSPWNLTGGLGKQ